jgi:hypothetical protein
MKLGKVFVVIIFSLAMCWTVQHFVNLSTTVFTVAQVPISWTMLCFCASMGLCGWLLGK